MQCRLVSLPYTSMSDHQGRYFRSLCCRPPQLKSPRNGSQLGQEPAREPVTWRPPQRQPQKSMELWSTVFEHGTSQLVPFVVLFCAVCSSQRVATADEYGLRMSTPAKRDRWLQVGTNVEHMAI